jgi:hypothetical protein
MTRVTKNQQKKKRFTDKQLKNYLRSMLRRFYHEAVRWSKGCFSEGYHARRQLKVLEPIYRELDSFTTVELLSHMHVYSMVAIPSSLGAGNSEVRTRPSEIQEILKSFGQEWSFKEIVCEMLDEETINANALNAYNLTVELLEEDREAELARIKEAYQRSVQAYQEWNTNQLEALLKRR